MKGFFSKKETESVSRPDGKVYSCTSCSLYKKCITPKMKPTGNFKKGIMNIGEFPSVSDDASGKHFNGKEGRFLKRIYREVGIDLHEDCININAINCAPLKDDSTRKPTLYEIDCCRKIVLNAIEEYKPKVIVLLGDGPIYAIFKNYWKRDLGTIQKWRGWAIPDPNFNAWLIPTYSPKMVVDYDKAEMHTIWRDDLQQVAKKVKEELPAYKEPAIKYLKDLTPLDMYIYYRDPLVPDRTLQGEVFFFP